MSSDFKRTLVHFGHAVRALREEAGISQMALAERAELSLTYVSEMERANGKIPSLETVTKLAKAFKLSGAELLERAGI